MEIKNRFIVITSIFKPTEAIEKFAALKGYRLVVVGDRKTPSDWAWPGVEYLPVSDERVSRFQLAQKLPFNHYGRKMLGYLHAIHEGAELIIDTDDDNIPKEGWDFPGFTGSFESLPENSGFVNMYKAWSSMHIWPRGFPLKKINTPFSFEALEKKSSTIGIWQGLADEDPDVDAIYRLVSNEPCYFEERAPIVLEKGTICPFNSQNTAYAKELFPLLYLPAFVTFRFTDILRGLVAQPILWQHGYQLGFLQATVVQKRNEHDYLKDFESEIPCYLFAEKIIESVSKVVKSTHSIKENLVVAYEELHRQNIVPEKELDLLQGWVSDLD